MASLKPLGTVRYHLKPVNADNPNRCQPAHITVINSHVTASHKYFDITTVEKSENLIDVENENLKLFACPCEGLPQVSLGYYNYIQVPLILMFILNRYKFIFSQVGF